MSTFGGSLGIEVKSKGIDVCVVHPSPVASNFYDKAHKLDMMGEGRRGGGMCLDMVGEGGGGVAGGRGCVGINPP